MINPPYDEDGRYAVLQYDTTTFTATIDGVDNPEWNITLELREYRVQILNQKLIIQMALLQLKTINYIKVHI